MTIFQPWLFTTETIQTATFTRFVVTTTKVVVAVANMRKLNPTMAWIEAVRTSQQHRNNGLAFRLLQSMLEGAARHSSYKQVLSCTSHSNKAMRRVFDKLQMKQLAQIQMIKFDALKALPGWAASDSKPSCQHLLQALNVKHFVSERARSMQWHAVESKKELERILANIQSKGGCGFMPGIYQVVDGQRVQDAIQQGLVFSLDQDSAVVVFLRDARISSLKSNWSLSLAGVCDEHLQAALWYACSPNMQAKLTKGMGQQNSCWVHCRVRWSHSIRRPIVFCPATDTGRVSGISQNTR